MFVKEVKYITGKVVAVKNTLASNGRKRFSMMVDTFVDENGEKIWFGGFGICPYKEDDQVKELRITNTLFNEKVYWNIYSDKINMSEWYKRVETKIDNIIELLQKRGD